jgi:hypothetical protein
MSKRQRGQACSVSSHEHTCGVGPIHICHVCVYTHIWLVSSGYPAPSTAQHNTAQHSKSITRGTPAINEGCTRSLRSSHTSRWAPLQPVSKTQVPCTPYHPPTIAGVGMGRLSRSEGESNAHRVALSANMAAHQQHTHALLMSGYSVGHARTTLTQVRLKERVHPL